jgi:hypothetical protein
VFASQTEAKRFLIDKIAAQAQAEGAALSEGEHWMLGFSESDPEFAVDVDRVQQFEAETSAEQFERKISGLLRRCYKRDAESNADVKLLYQTAYRRLQEGDHYLGVMVDRALGAELHSGGSSALKSLCPVGLSFFSSYQRALRVLWPWALSSLSSMSQQNQRAKTSPSCLVCSSSLGWPITSFVCGEEKAAAMSPPNTALKPAAAGGIMTRPRLNARR